MAAPKVRSRGSQVPMREPNRRLRRRLLRDEETRVARVAAQPHRRGERTNVAASPWQRALKAGLVFDPRPNGWTPADLEQAGLLFCEARVNYRKAIAAGFPFASARGGSGRELPPALVERWQAEWGEILAVLRRHGNFALRAVMSAEEAHPEAEERLWDDAFCHALGRALAALATHFKIGA